MILFFHNPKSKAIREDVGWEGMLISSGSFIGSIGSLGPSEIGFTFHGINLLGLLGSSGIAKASHPVHYATGQAG